ncbi:MAG: MBL fold metallo-hydrolase RNA specificity domain-containing protein [Candidatus Bilamarchaeaceae archaeon]
MRVHCLGAGREVGRSCFLLETDQRVLFDYGLKIFNYGSSKENMYPVPYQGSVDAAFLSHAHLDHSGLIPELYSRGPINWFSTPPTYELSALLWEDSMKIMGEGLPYTEQQFRKALNGHIPLLYGQTVTLGATRYKFYDAGHIAGSAIIEAKYKGKKLLYSGDFKMEDTRMHNGAVAPGEVDALILESTYSNREHPDREKTEDALADLVSDTLDDGGSVLFPSFAVGRSQELISILHENISGIQIYLDGMSKEVTRTYLKYPEYLRDFEEFEEALESVIFVEGARDRKDAATTPSVIISTAGMMEGGPALSYMLNLNPASRIVFTGYCVEGTNGWRIQKENKVMVDKNLLDVPFPVSYFDFSAHAGRSDLLKFVKETNPGKIILNHGDRTEEFASELKAMGFNAVAPRNGDSIDI